MKEIIKIILQWCALIIIAILGGATCATLKLYHVPEKISEWIGCLIGFAASLPIVWDMNKNIWKDKK